MYVIELLKKKHTHTHTHIYILIYISFRVFYSKLLVNMFDLLYTPSYSQLLRKLNLHLSDVPCAPRRAFKHSH